MLSWLKEKRIYRRLCFFILLFFGSVCLCDEQFDKSRHIGIDEIKPGMQGYCLTCFKGTDVEKCALEVLAVVPGMTVGRDAILVKSTDESFVHAGVIGGVSGSPVYIDGRLAGAMAFGWPNSKDPVYGVTPIKDMLKAGTGGAYKQQTDGFCPDLSRPIDFADIEKQFRDFLASRKLGKGNIESSWLPLVVSGAGAGLDADLDNFVEPLGIFSQPMLPVAEDAGAAFSAVSGAAAEADPCSPSGTSSGNEAGAKLTAGASLIVPLVTGDITLAVTGTATEVSGNDVYGFGHGFLGMGAVDLPMATGQVHTVVASYVRSFKIASPLRIVGALKTDESTAVRGRIGEQAAMCDMKVFVDRYNDIKTREYKCKVARERSLTPGILASIVGGTAFYLGDLPVENSVEYKVTINAEQAEPISFSNVSSGATGVAEVMGELAGATRLLMNNPYKRVGIESVDVRLRIINKNIQSHIWSVQVSNTTVRAGEDIDINVVLETIDQARKQYAFRIKTPDKLPPGRYELAVCGEDEYRNLLSRLAPQRYMAENFQTLVKALNEVLSLERDKLYCVLILPASGIVLESQELSGLPASRALILNDARRLLSTQPCQQWIETAAKTGLITIDGKTVQIKVEQ